MTLPPARSCREVVEKVGDSAGRRGAREAYPDSLVKDIIPYVEKNYRVLAKRDSRAVAGLSMGGIHTISARTTHPDPFGYIGVFSSGPRNSVAFFL
jgi:enterochelin esterase-like enzyme